MKRLLIVALFFSLGSPAFGESWIRENFFLADADLSGVTYYLGYQSKESGWYIKAIDQSTMDVKRFSYVYIAGNEDYAHHWANRATLSGVSHYRTFDEAF